MPPYIPPSRHKQAGANTQDGSSSGPSQRGSTYNPRYNTRGQRGGQFSRGSSRGRGDRHRGEGRPSPNQPQPGPPIDDANLFRYEDIENHFWPSLLETMPTRSTFLSSEQHPEDLSCIFLFSGANPRWMNDQIVFAKSRLDLLPEYSIKKEEHGEWPVTKRQGPARATTEGGQTTTTSMSEASLQAVQPEEVTDFAHPRTIPAAEWYPARANDPPVYPSIPAIDYTPAAHPPIAVFEEVKGRGIPNSHVRGGNFVFAGWYTLSRISLLAPNSSELVRMQTQKWERKDRFGGLKPDFRRDAEAWASSLNHEWAVVKFQKLPEDVAPPNPIIRKQLHPNQDIDAENKSVKSVNQLLQEMRLEDGQGAAAASPDGMDKDLNDQA